MGRHFLMHLWIHCTAQRHTDPRPCPPAIEYYLTGTCENSPEGPTLRPEFAGTHLLLPLAYIGESGQSFHTVQFPNGKHPRPGRNRCPVRTGRLPNILPVPFTHNTG